MGAGDDVGAIAGERQRKTVEGGEWKVESGKNCGEAREVEVGFEPKIGAGGNERDVVPLDTDGDFGEQRALRRAGGDDGPIANAGKLNERRGVG